MSVALAAVGLAAAQAASAARTAVAPVPTSVTIFTAEEGAGSFAGLIALQKLAGGSVRVVGLLTGLPAGAADLALVPTSACDKPQGHEQLRLHIKSGRVFDVQGRPGAVGPGTSLALLLANYKQVACLKPAAFTRTGAVVKLYPRGVTTAPATGIVAFKRATWPMRILAMGTKPPAANGSARLSSAPCSTAPTGANQLLQTPLYRIAPFLYGAVAKSELASFGRGRSLNVVPIGCARWDAAATDALEG